MALPATYSGEAVDCSVCFASTLLLYSNAAPKIRLGAIEGGLLDLLALWTSVALGTSYLEHSEQSFDAFSAHFKEVFGLSTGSLSTADQLIHLRQGTSSVSDYTLQFRTLAASCGWNEMALIAANRQGLRCVHTRRE